MPIYGLDHWLTTEPEDGFNDWSETVCDNYPDFVPDSFIQTDTEIKWLEKLFDQFDTMDPKRAAAIIGRAYRLYFHRENSTNEKN